MPRVRGNLSASRHPSAAVTKRQLRGRLRLQEQWMQSIQLADNGEPGGGVVDLLALRSDMNKLVRQIIPEDAADTDLINVVGTPYPAAIVCRWYGTNVRGERVLIDSKIFDLHEQKKQKANT